LRFVAAEKVRLAAAGQDGDPGVGVGGEVVPHRRQLSFAGGGGSAFITCVRLIVP